MDKRQPITLRTGIIIGMILFAALSRLLPHPPNVTPVGAMALFGAAYFGKKYWAIIIPLVALWVSNLLLNNIVYAQMYPEAYTGFTWFGYNAPFVFGAIALIAVLGFGLLKIITVKNTVLASLLASTVFFLVTNFGTWAVGMLYPMSLEGLVACYTAALPYFLNTLVGDLFFVGVLFGSFELLKDRFPKLELSHG